MKNVTGLGSQESRPNDAPPLAPLFVSRWHFVSLTCIVLGSCGLALYWVFLVPIYQAPDEPMNWDYALAISEHGIFRVQGASFERLPPLVHPYSMYLCQKAEVGRIAFRAGEKMPPEYGTLEYYARLDAEAPSRKGLRIDSPNSPFAVYPYGYYGLLAIWIKVLEVYCDKPVYLFFGSRCLSVILLAISLCLTHATLRRMGYRARSSLFMTGIIGFFPLTSFVASAIQMDNLSFTGVALCFYLAVRLKRDPVNYLLLALLGLAFGGLLVTKLHFFFCVSVAILLMLATRFPIRTTSLTRILKIGGLLVTPATITGSIYLWSTWGTTNLYAPPAEYADPWLHNLEWLKKAILDYFVGISHVSFWGWFGWVDAPLVIRDLWFNELAWFAIQVFSWLFLVLTLIRLEKVFSRLVVLAWRGRRWQAIRIAFSDPVLNSYFLFTLFMIWLYVRLENRFAAQGRNWWPLILPIFLTGLVYAPRALSLRLSGRMLAKTAGALLLAFCVLGSNYALKSVKKRYYLPGQVRTALLQQRRQAASSVDRVDDDRPLHEDQRKLELNGKRLHRKWLLSVP